MSSFPDVVAIKDRQRQSWGSGDYQQVASTFVLDSELLCEAIDLKAGQTVLDIAGGSGNTALAAARRFAVVTCTDYVPELLERASLRAAAEGLPLTVQEADAERLPFANRSFDVVLSTFGVMFALDQVQAAREVLRVCRPGGTIALANWTPEGFAGDFFRVIGRYVLPQAGFLSPLRWGTEQGIRELFGDDVREVRVMVRQHSYRYHSPEHFVDFFRTNYGPTGTAFDTLDADRQNKLAQELADVVRQYARSGEDTAIWPGEYLEVVATRA